MPTTPIFDLRTLEGAKIHASASYKKLKLLEKQKTTLCERRMQEDCWDKTSRLWQVKS